MRAPRIYNSIVQVFHFVLNFDFRGKRKNPKKILLSEVFFLKKFSTPKPFHNQKKVAFLRDTRSSSVFGAFRQCTQRANAPKKQKVFGILMIGNVEKGNCKVCD
jgi:hypothetical protein